MEYSIQLLRDRLNEITEKHAFVFETKVELAVELKSRAKDLIELGSKIDDLNNAIHLLENN